MSNWIWIHPERRDRSEIRMSTLVIEISGGGVQEIYTDAKDLRVIKINWDEGESPGDAHCGADMPTVSLADLSPETLGAIFDVTDDHPLADRSLAAISAVRLFFLSQHLEPVCRRILAKNGRRPR